MATVAPNPSRLPSLSSIGEMRMQIATSGARGTSATTTVLGVISRSTRGDRATYTAAATAPPQKKLTRYNRRKVSTRPAVVSPGAADVSEEFPVRAKAAARRMSADCSGTNVCAPTNVGRILVGVCLAD